MGRWTPLLVLVLPAFGCTQFNFPANVYYQLIVAMSGSNLVRVYESNPTNGALSLVTSISVTSPTLVAAHPSSGAFWVYKNNTSLECYQFHFRSGTDPTLGSSTTVSGLIQDLQVVNDGSSITYSKSGNSNLFWRTVENCVMGIEVSVSAPGKTTDVFLSQTSSGAIVTALEDSGVRIWKFSRASGGGLTLAGTYLGTLAGSKPSITPDGRYLLFNLGSTVSVLNLEEMTTVNSVVSGVGDVQRLIAISDTRALGLRPSATHLPITLASGTPSVGTSVDFGIADFAGGYAEYPTKNIFYTGSQGDTSVWAHVVQESSPFVGTPTQYVLPDIPESLAILPSFRR